MHIAWIFNTESKMSYDIMPQNFGPCCWFMSNCQTSSVIVPQSRPRGLLDSASVHSKRQNWFNSRSIWVSFGFPYWWSSPRVGWLRLGDHYTVPRRDQPSATFLKTLGSVFFSTQPYLLIFNFPNSRFAYPARALRALGLLLADVAPTVGRGETFWGVNHFFLTKTAVTP